jgi:hypothetical protein
MGTDSNLLGTDWNPMGTKKNPLGTDWQENPLSYKKAHFDLSSIPKKNGYPRGQPIFINLKSNTMKNT